MSPRLSETMTSTARPSPQISKCNGEYELQYTRWLLIALGIWSRTSDNAAQTEKACSRLTSCVFVFAAAITVIPCLMFSLITVKTMEERLVFIGPLGFHVINILKWLFIMCRADSMKKCINHMRTDWLEAVTREEQNVMLKSADLGRRLTRMCAIFMYSGAIFFQAKTIFAPEGIAVNETSRRHVLPRYNYILNWQLSPAFEIAYSTHTTLMVFLYTIEIVTCNLTAVFASHICGQVQVMKLKLKRLEDFSICGRSESVVHCIAAVIHCHVRILTQVNCRMEFVVWFENIRNALREICLVEVVYSTVVMCWLEFYCLREWSNSETLSLVAYITLFISLTFNIFILCYIGEILKNECESVAETTYMIDWCQISPNKLSSLILIITMARYRLGITAGGMMEMTLQSFGSASISFMPIEGQLDFHNLNSLQVLKTSFLYFQMLRTVTESS
ncbi:uncharacterized protein LOC135173019 [Diachasmimorpha longicaudata]|uniref:uncharacterized protein LOC135173019 n=1 Tax=Diachasmimorpha longicaudata TaxID=58733 RepID=UPI0030B8D7F7